MTNREKQPCLLCRGRDLEVLHALGTHLITRCRGCSLVFVNPTPDREKLLGYAEECYGGGGISETREMFAGLGSGYSKDDPVVRSYERVLERLEAHSQGRRKLLDVGCGTGAFVDMAARRGFDARGMDSSKTATGIAIREFGIEASPGDFDTHTFEEGSFDCVTMLDFLEHVPDPLATVRKAVRVLKNDGLLVIVSPNHRSLLYMLADCLRSNGRFKTHLEKLYHFSHVVLFDPYSMRFLLEKAGLVPLEMWQESPYIKRYSLPRHIRLGLELVNMFSRPLKLESRIGVLARKGLRQR